MAVSWSLKRFPDDLSDWGDSALLKASRWDRNAPAELVAAAREGTTAVFGSQWRADLRQRKQGNGALPRQLLTGWSVLPIIAESQEDSVLQTWLKAQSAKSSRRPTIKPKASWLVRIQPLIEAFSAAEAPDGTPFPTEVLAALELLWTVGDRLPQRVWWPLWRGTLGRLQQLASQPISPQATPDERLLLEGEIPVLAGLVYFHLGGASDLIRKGQRVLCKSLESQTDTDGTPHGELLPRLPYWLAPLVRVTGWCQQAGQSVWDEDDRELLSLLLEKGVSLCRADGTLSLSNGLEVDALPIFLHAADLLDWPAGNPARASLRSMAEHAAGTKRRSPASGAISLMPSNQSDWARVALLRTDWSAGAASIAIAHHQSLPRLDVTVHGRSIIQGDWGLDVRMGDASVELAEEWSCVCWESQPEADYAELQMAGPGRLRIERMLLLSREDQFLMIADSISGASSTPLAVRSRLSFAPDVRLLRDGPTRALRLESGNVKLRAYPLSFPSNTVQGSAHAMAWDGQTLTVEYAGAGQGLFAPIILDFDPRRRRREVNWRQLTVTEEGKVVGSDVATAFRWQVAKEQWLVYRSLRTPKVPRATLGYHTGQGFALGRFDTNGDVDPIIMVES